EAVYRLLSWGFCYGMSGPFLFSFFFSSRRRHTRSKRDWSSDVCSSDLSLDVLISKHKQTGAMHYHLAHPSDENAFLVGFRTQPRSEERRVGKECRYRWPRFQ